MEILRSKCGTRVLGVPHSEHIELLRAEARVARRFSVAVSTIATRLPNASAERDFFAKKLAYIKKKQYLCRLN